jgi:hypothetical protein
MRRPERATQRRTYNGFPILYPTTIILLISVASTVWADRDAAFQKSVWTAQNQVGGSLRMRIIVTPGLGHIAASLS